MLNRKTMKKKAEEENEMQVSSYQFLNMSQLLKKGGEHSGAVDQNWDGMGEIMSSILLSVGFFPVDTFFQKDAC